MAIVEFSDSGERLKTVHVPKVVKTEEEWRKQLSRGVFSITRQSDTELAFSGEYWNLHEKGLFRCICCDNALFTSDTKLLGADRARQRSDYARRQLGYGQDSCLMHRVRRTFGTRIRRWSRTHGSALLHEFSVLEVRRAANHRGLGQVGPSINDAPSTSQDR